MPRCRLIDFIDIGSLGHFIVINKDLRQLDQIKSFYMKEYVCAISIHVASLYQKPRRQIYTCADNSNAFKYDPHRAQSRRSTQRNRRRQPAMTGPLASMVRDSPPKGSRLHKPRPLPLS